MLNAVALLDAAAVAQQCSDWRLAKLIGVSHTNVSNWRTGRAIPQDEPAAALGKLAGLDVGYVLACMHAERAQTDDLKRVWLELALARLPVDAGQVDKMSAAPAPAPSAGGPSLQLMSNERVNRRRPRASAAAARQAARALARVQGAPAWL